MSFQTGVVGRRLGGEVCSCLPMPGGEVGKCHAMLSSVRSWHAMPWLCSIWLQNPETCLILRSLLLVGSRAAAGRFIIHPPTNLAGIMPGMAMPGMPW